MSSLPDRLKAAKALINDPAHWMQFAFAGTKDGDVVPVGNSRATRLCSYAATALASGTDLEGAQFGLPRLARAAVEAMSVLEKEMHGEICHYNNSHSHAEVMAAFDRAIARAEAGDYEPVDDHNAQEVDVPMGVYPANYFEARRRDFECNMAKVVNISVYPSPARSWLRAYALDAMIPVPNRMRPALVSARV